MMTGKELKAYAWRVPDDAVIAVRERSYGAWEPRFEMQATLTVGAQVQPEPEDVSVLTQEGTR